MTSVLAPPIVEAPPAPRPGAARFGRTAWLVGLVGFLVSFAWSWQPSFWGDEAASVMSAERSLPSLFRMLGHVDAVHGTYYLFLHYWIGLFGASELSTRLPSALAIGVAAAGTVVLTRILVNARVAVIAGLVFSVLPRVTYMGGEARSSALATAIAVWLTVLLVHLLRTSPESGRVRIGWWAGYAVLLAAGTYMFLDLVLLIPAHALAVVLSRRRKALAPWALATGAGLALAAPVLYWGAHERNQISFIGRRPQVSLLDAAVNQWFGNPALAVLAWGLVILAVVVVFGTRRGRRTRARATRSVVAVALAWLLVPTVVLFLGTRLITPMYSLRYLSFCAPAAAIVIAIGIASIRVRWAQFAAVLLIVGLAAPTYLYQRSDFAKDGAGPVAGSDLRQAAAVVQAGAHPGDAVVFDESVRPSRKPRLALHLYPDAFRGLRDITLQRPFETRTGLWDTTVPLSEATGELTNTGTVWLLQNRGSTESTDGTDLRTLEQAGFTALHSTTVHRTVVIELTR